MARSRLYPPSVDPGLPAPPLSPRGWSAQTFRDVLEVVERPVQLEDDVRYQLLTAKRSRGGIVLRETLPGREILTKTQFLARAGDFLISRRQIIHGACGVVARELDASVVSNEYSTLRTRESMLMEYLRYFSYTPYFQRTCFHSSHGVDVEKMVFKLDRWLQWPVSVPPLAEQRKIAAILSSVDEAIEKTQAVINQVQVVKKGLMQELLTRGLPGHHKKFKKTEIGEIPEEWEVQPVGELFETCSGGTPNREVAEYWAGPIPWVKTGEIAYQDILTTEETVSQLGIDDSAAKLLPKGTLVMAMYGQGATRGRVAILGIEAACNQACVAFLPNPRISTRFLLYVFHSRYDELRELGHEGTQKNLNAGLVKRVLVPRPPAVEQEMIVDALDAMGSRSQHEAARLRALAVLKSALMSVLLTGEVRVKPDPEDA